ncbi:MAG: hypothetical protein J5501_04950 [Ruminococcus sp.]|nr:hypothetical protein [Ruminococcus sp.]
MNADKTYYCFADFEFTCGANIGINTCELLSAGAVICSSDYEIVERFYCTSRPVCRPRLTKQCRKLTKLTQEEISASDDSNKVLSDLLALLDRYSVDKIWVWGNFDKPAISSDMRNHQRKLRPASSISATWKRIIDIQETVVKKLGLPQAVSIGELSSVFGYTPETGTFHNALNDAMAFYWIHRAAYTSDLEANEKFTGLRRERLERLEHMRLEAQQTRLEAGKAVPMTPAEREYYTALCVKGTKGECRSFLKLRLNILKGEARFPEGARLAAIYYPTNHQVRVITEEQLDDSLIHPNARILRYIKGKAEIIPLVAESE